METINMSTYLKKQLEASGDKSYTVSSHTETGG